MRNRTHPAVIRYGLYLYFSSRSFRLAAKSLASIKKRSHVSIWKWVQKYSGLIDRISLRNKPTVKKKIFVDETLLQIDGQDYWLWIAYEPNVNKCLMICIYISRERTIFICYQFFKQLRKRYGRKPIYSQMVLDGMMMMLANG
jgi:transposase-like protein